MLKNSLTGKWSKKLAIGSPTNDDLGIGGHFPISKIPAILTKREFFNRHRRFCNNQSQ
jgi:hypothetical protein